MMLPQTTSAFSDQQFPIETNNAIIPFPNNRYLINEPNDDWHPKVMERLQFLIDLEIGWDGYQGEPVTLENATFALKILETVCSYDAPPPQIVPGSNGDLQIEWHTHVVEIELHVIAPNKVNAWIANDDTGPDGKEQLLTTDFTVVADQIRRMTEQE